MADHTKLTNAGGAKYHTLKATATWAEFRDAMQTHAGRTELARLRTDAKRMRADASVRHPNT